MSFQATLENARYEVNIDLYPGDSHYQIYKPDCPSRHCWEVYENPQTDDECEVNMSCDTLDDAIRAMEKYHAGKRYESFKSAMDTVCLHCAYETGDECESCMVRKTYDLWDELRRGQ